MRAIIPGPVTFHRDPAISLFHVGVEKKTYAGYDVLSQRLRSKRKYLFRVAAPLKHSPWILLALYQGLYTTAWLLTQFKQIFDQTPTPPLPSCLIFCLCISIDCRLILKNCSSSLDYCGSKAYIYPLYHLRFHPIISLLQPRLLFLSCKDYWVVWLFSVIV